MSRTHRHHSHAMVIAVDRNYLPMQEVPRQHALIAVANGRAYGLDVRTWARLGIGDLRGKVFQVVVFPGAQAVSDGKLGFGRGNSAILRRDGYLCQYEGCNRRGTTVDHVIPRCQGGKSTWSNLVAACPACNLSKGGRTPEQAGMKLKQSARSPRWRLMERFNDLVSAA